MEVNRTLRLPDAEYFPRPYRKSLVILHHTVGGSARSTFNWWKMDRSRAGTLTRVGTAYIVERDGTIYEVFPPGFWAYHLGLKGLRGVVDRRSIGIELASEGPLLQVAGKFYCFGRVSERTEFTGKVFDFGREYRQQYRYFAAYTEGQIDATARLVKHLTEDFDVPAQTPRNHLSFNMEKFKDYQGILGHVHLRADKTDPHPGFPWEEIVSECGLRLT